MEEYSEAKTYKSKPELRKSNVKADLFLFISGNSYCHSQPEFVREFVKINHGSTETREQMSQVLGDICTSSSEYTEY